MDGFRRLIFGNRLKHGRSLIGIIIQVYNLLDNTFSVVERQTQSFQFISCIVVIDVSVILDYLRNLIV
ncbi:hypothetical protein WI85_16505 [Burkholderia ubonensis]|nr:hypothetical protein WI85_16505 [Burkholderia ubonensis]